MLDDKGTDDEEGSVPSLAVALRTDHRRHGMK